MNLGSSSVKFSEIQQNAYLADLHSKIYDIPQSERVKVLMSWIANAYSDLLISVLPENEGLSIFTAHVKLLDTFANNSSYDVVVQLASEFSENFLKSQVIPNLLENQQKTADITNYIEVICENLTCPSLIRKLMDVVTMRLTHILIGRMMSDNYSIATSTLSLLKTLLEFYCEDLWYDLVLQYLLPMKHLLTSQRERMLPEIEFHESTNKLLELIPKRMTDTIAPPVIAENFLLYFQDEITRLRVIDSAVVAALPSSKSDLQKVGLNLEDESTEFSTFLGGEDTSTKKVGKNPTYPMWIFKYDGTDVLYAIRSGIVQEPEEFFDDDLFSVGTQLNSGSERQHDEEREGALSRSLLSNDESNYDLATLSYNDVDSNSNLMQRNLTGSSPNQGLDSLGSLPEPTARSKRGSADDSLTTGAYFGPFLHALYEILRKWTVLEPDVLFTATELISVLASSRIPLINTLFLDMSLILQPRYPSFSSTIHRVKNELDESLKKYPDFVLRNAWKTASKGSSAEYEWGESSAAVDETSFVDTLKRTIAANRTIQMAAEEVQRTLKVGRRRSFRAFTDLFKTQKQSTRASEFRLLNRSSAPYDSEEEERVVRVMALRCVLFTHWMLELGAIALHLSWGRRSFHGNQNVRLANNHSEPPPDCSLSELADSEFTT